MEAVKTVVLLTLMTLLMVWVGGVFGGQSGMLIALAIAGVMNFFSYFYSDKLVLRHYHAVEVDERSAPGLLAMVRRLADKAGIPMPKVYIIPEQVPNAFATGRNPSHAAVAVTEGLLELLNEEEVEAVRRHYCRCDSVDSQHYAVRCDIRGRKEPLPTPSLCSSCRSFCRLPRGSSRWLSAAVANLKPMPVLPA